MDFNSCIDLYNIEVGYLGCWNSNDLREIQEPVKNSNLFNVVKPLQFELNPEMANAGMQLKKIQAMSRNKG